MGSTEDAMKIKVAKKHCTGCKLCMQICAIHHYEEINPRKAAIQIDAAFPDPGVYTPKLCVQCGKCMEACPEDAISLIGDAYIIDPEPCTNCGICVEVCPFDVMFVHADAPTPIMCDLCMKCTEVCNTGALTAAE